MGELKRRFGSRANAQAAFISEDSSLAGLETLDRMTMAVQIKEDNICKSDLWDNSKHQL